MPFTAGELLVGGFTESDWAESIEGQRSPRSDTFSVRRGDCKLTAIIPGYNLKAAIQYILGVAYVDGTSLKRSLPAYHPVHTWMWAESIDSIQGMSCRGVDLNANGYIDSLEIAEWEKYEVVVSFALPSYNVLSDDAVTYEYERFVETNLHPSTELVQVDNGIVVYDAPGETFDSKPGLQVVARRETAGVKLKWHNVPAEFVHDANTLPQKLLSIQGKINGAEFLGMPAYTLLCKEVRLEKFPQPLATESAGELYFSYDIEFDFIWYDPTPKGYTSSEQANGWNYQIAPDLKYYYCQLAGSGLTIYQDFDFASAFTHWSL